MGDQPDFTRIDGYVVRRPYGKNTETAAVPPAAEAARPGFRPPFTRTRRTLPGDGYLAEIDKVRRERGLARDASIGDILAGPVLKVSIADILVFAVIAALSGAAIGIALHSGAVL